MQSGILKKEEEIKTEENLEKYGIKNEGPYGCGPISAWILTKNNTYKQFQIKI